MRKRRPRLTPDLAPSPRLTPWVPVLAAIALSALWLAGWAAWG